VGVVGVVCVAEGTSEIQRSTTHRNASSGLVPAGVQQHLQEAAAENIRFLKALPHPKRH
jgi:hypothetical protein